MSAGRRRSERPRRLYAHRGAAVELPENTIESFARALEIGVDALEMDGHLSADGHVIISHDPSGERMCGVNAMIRSSRLEEIRRWDAGARFQTADGAQPHAGRGMRMPTFDEVLSEFPDTMINIDLKQRQPSMVEATLGVIDEHDAADRVLLASFSTRTLLAARRAGYRGLTALPRNELLAFLAMPRRVYQRMPWRGDAAQLPTHVGPINVGRRYIIDKCHDVGVRADFWTVNDPAHAEALLDLGADGIMTDDPAAIAPVFERFRARASS